MTESAFTRCVTSSALVRSMMLFMSTCKRGKVLAVSRRSGQLEGQLWKLSVSQIVSSRRSPRLKDNGTCRVHARFSRWTSIDSRLPSEHLSSHSQVKSEAALPERQTACCGEREVFTRQDSRSHSYRTCIFRAHAGSLASFATGSLPHACRECQFSTTKPTLRRPKSSSGRSI